MSEHDHDLADELIPLIVAMRNAKYEVAACTRFVQDAQADLSEAILKQGRALDAYNAWVVRQDELPLPSILTNQ